MARLNERNDWFDLWFEDKQAMMGTMMRNMAADLAAGYNYFGASIAKQRGEIERYKAQYEVMSKAWEIYHANKQPGGLRPVFSICLEMAWEHVKNSNILNQWQAMSEQQQINMLTACVKRAAKNEIGYSTEDHYLQYNETVAWFLGYHGLDGLVNEAWLKLADRLDADYLEALNAKRAAAGKVNISLTSLVYRSAKDAIRKVYNDDIKRGRGRVDTITDKNGEQVDALETVATNRKDNTEPAVVSRLALDEFVNGRDEKDRMIIEGIRDGYLSKEIAAMIGISEAAVCKRLKKIRADLVASGMVAA